VPKQAKKDRLKDKSNEGTRGRKETQALGIAQRGINPGIFHHGYLSGIGPY